MLGLQSGERALVIATHPDDETLGAAGTIAALANHHVAVDVLAVACLSGPMHGGVSDAAVRHAEFTEACKILGAASARIAWTDTAQAANPAAYPAEMVALIEDALAVTCPAAVLLPTGGHHQDHQAVHHAALAALRPGHRDSRPLPRLVMGYDGPEDRAWRAAALERPVMVDITTTTEVKQQALACYASQLRPDPHPRSREKIQALDQAAGAARGVDAAESFALYRMAA